MTRTLTFKQVAAESKQKLDGYGEELRAEWQKRKGTARGSVINLFKNGKGERARRGSDHAEEALGPRPVSRRTKAPSKSSMPVFDISDDVLERLVVDPNTRAKKPSQGFLAKQRRRAGMPGHSHSSSTPLAALTQAELDEQPIDAEDIIYMFAGAPYFDIDEDGDHLNPNVVLGWGPSVSSSQDQTDYQPFKHTSFSVCTAQARNADADLTLSRKRRRLPPRERPSMLAWNGKDSGTIGFSHFLELPLQQKQTPSYRAMTANQQHLLARPHALGLRNFDVEDALDRLSELSKVYETLLSGRGEAADWNQQMIEEIGEDLFSTLLDDDLGTTAAGTGCVSLYTQISALQRVLSTDHLWYDFSREEWRAKFGRLLWDPHEVEMPQGQWLNERDLLLFQIALSAELAVRLELANRLAGSETRSNIFTQADLDIVVKHQTETLDWDLLLFQRFVQCFEISSRQHGSRSPLRRPDSSNGAAAEVQEPDLVLTLRKQREQWEGLQFFASALGWPDLDRSKERFSLPKFDSFMTPPVQDQPESANSEYGTPMSTPRTTPPPHLQNTPALIYLRSQQMLIMHSALEELTSDPKPLSWRSLAWLSGTIMPGGSAPQLLMRTLLEMTSDGHMLPPPEPVRDGYIVFPSESPDIEGGFVYKHQMYWNKDSVVGRVLAPSPDAKECMGWMSMPFVPQGSEDGPIHPYVLDAPYAAIEPRLFSQDRVAVSSDPLHSNDASQLQAGAFTTLVDGHLIMGNEAQLQGVSFTPAKITQHTADGSTPPKVINLTFKSPRNNKMQPLTLPLIHEVQFVASYPCYPYTKRRRRGTTHGTSPAAHDSAAPTASGSSSPLSSTHNKDLPVPPAHPLHVNFTHTIIPAAALLSSELPGVKDSDSLILVGDSTANDKPSVYQIEDQEVIVLDCRGSSELEVLARAWCSKVGEHALIGKSGRTCLACCIREAIGLGMGVVIRIS